MVWIPQISIPGPDQLKKYVFYENPTSLIPHKSELWIMNYEFWIRTSVLWIMNSEFIIQNSEFTIMYS